MAQAFGSGLIISHKPATNAAASAAYIHVRYASSTDPNVVPASRYNRSAPWHGHVRIASHAPVRLRGVICRPAQRRRAAARVMFRSYMG
jgi:hypothetical protein